tara:strand:- start:585 stop:785 length:201 start_codon:yes stop_codon:yes gene_type:complete
MDVIKNINIAVTFKSSVCNEFTKTPCWKVEAYILGNLFTDISYEGKNSTEKKVLRMCEDKVRKLIK